MFSHFLRKLAAVARGFGRPSGTLIRSGGMHWQLEPDAATVFGAAGPDPVAWRTAGLAHLVKQNLQRSIWRVRLPGGTVYVKECRVNTPRSWAREVLRPAKARLEFENAVALKRLGVVAVEPLAWGAASHVWPGTSVLVTRGEDGAAPFLDLLEQNPALAVRRQLTRGFACYLARMHDAGVAHPDPHPGNFLVELQPAGEPRFVLTDLHAVRFGKPLSWPDTRANLTLLNRWFQLRASGPDRLRFWTVYWSARTTLTAADPSRMAGEVERATEESNNRFWVARLDRYLGDNRDTKRVRAHGVTGFAVRDLPDEVVRRWLADPDAMISEPGAKVLKGSRTSTVVARPIGSRGVVCKRFNLRSRSEAAKNLFRSSPALRSWVLGNNVRDRGLPTARPLLVLHRRTFGVPLTGYVVFETVPDSLGLPEAVALLDRHPPAVRRAWAERLGMLVRLMHARQVSHRDLKAPNVLIAGAATEPAAAMPVLIDLVGVEVGRPVSDATRVRDLARLNASFIGSPHVSRTDRLRVLRTYLGRGDWKSWWLRVDAATRAKAARNERTGRPLA